MPHKYKIGDTLEIVTTPLTSNRVSGPCRVLARLPFEGHVIQYRVQSVNERNERIVSEADLRVTSTSIPADRAAGQRLFSVAIARREPDRSLQDRRYAGRKTT